MVPFWVALNITRRVIIGIQKRTIILTTIQILGIVGLQPSDFEELFHPEPDTPLSRSVHGTQNPTLSEGSARLPFRILGTSIWGFQSLVIPG